LNANLKQNLPIVQKVYAYVLRQRQGIHQLLVFNHEDFPEAGIQVPGGSVEAGEEPFEAVLREVKKETGLEGLSLVSKLGVVSRDMRDVGLNALHERHYFQMDCQMDPAETWIADEKTPSDGSEGPILFRFYWVNLDAVPPLAGGTDEMLDDLML